MRIGTVDIDAFIDFLTMHRMTYQVGGGFIVRNNNVEAVKFICDITTDEQEFLLKLTYRDLII